MFRIVLLGGKVYSYPISSIEDDTDNIVDFVDQGNIVILVDDLETLEQIGISEESIIKVTPDGTSEPSDVRR